MTVNDIMDRVSTLYNDADFARVTQTMYLKFLDDALMQLVMARPDAHLKTVVVQLDPGTQQRLPEDCISLIDIFRNMGQDGVTQGRPVWQVNRKDMDYFSNWHATDPLAPEPTEITEFAYEKKNAKIYWVSPAPGATTPIFVELMYSFAFPPYATLNWADAITQTVPCDDVFMGAVCSYMLYLLYNTDAASKMDKTIGESYKSDFYNQLGLEYKASTINMPQPGDTVNINVQGAQQ